ncbi:MAG TPA: 4-phosphoerythronate dehydrogenase [Gammaproteobacteria bacterium]|nr:4-phosphoerythronate dehydrogenase [Gammaproteobacteria bacterium]
MMRIGVSGIQAALQRFVQASGAVPLWSLCLCGEIKVGVSLRSRFNAFESFPVKIVADENIPHVDEAFSSLGEVMTLPGRSMTRANLRGADILLVRSVTRVDAALLEGTPVRYVASATIGFDHIDHEYLERRGIPWTTAPGCNATAAAEYVAAAICRVASPEQFRGGTVGIVGRGNVGSRVRSRLEALGFRCLVNDPPLEEQGVADDFVSLDQALSADIVTLHTPLTVDDRHPTFHLLNKTRLAQLPDGALLINAARGAVVDNPALLAELRSERIRAVLDCWEGEPAIDTGLLDRVSIGTPHIAGYSLEGRLRGTEMILRAVCEFLGEPPRWRLDDALPDDPPPLIDLRGEPDDIEAMKQAVAQAYPIMRDDARLRRMAELPLDERGPWFDHLRKTYPMRREFGHFRVRSGGQRSALADRLQRLGFQLAD